jgi:energy-coupling factor transport system permease protein
MLVAWRYFQRGTFLESIDPRARWYTSFLVLFSFTIVQIWDIRYVIFFFCLAMLQFFMSRLTWKETRRVWTFVIILVVIIGINALVTGRGGTGRIAELEPHIVWEANMTVPLVHWNIHPTITVEKIAFAVTQILRMLATAVIFLIIPFTMDPRQYGVTFGGMGIPYRVAFSMDLAFRFVPTLARDFQITLDAQRSRGYELDQLKGGVFAAIRKMAPMIVPVVMNSIVNGEDIINAMDLRCFGLEERTWIDKLPPYRKRDYAWIGFGILCFITMTVLVWGFGFGEFYVPQIFYTIFL